jgi:hypothetical protein
MLAGSNHSAHKSIQGIGKRIADRPSSLSFSLALGLAMSGYRETLLETRLLLGNPPLFHRLLPLVSGTGSLALAMADTGFALGWIGNADAVNGVGKLQRRAFLE